MNVSQIQVGIVVARFNEIITSRLSDGARHLLLRRGISAENILSAEVPGSFELPLATRWMIEHHKVDAVIALGTVIRGTTDHYDYVCSSVASGLMNVQIQLSTPVGFGVLTCHTMEQAFDRAGGKLGNKGAETANAVLDMLALKLALPEDKVSC